MRVVLLLCVLRYSVAIVWSPCFGRFGILPERTPNTSYTPLGSRMVRHCDSHTHIMRPLLCTLFLMVFFFRFFFLSFAVVEFILSNPLIWTLVRDLNECKYAVSIASTESLFHWTKFTHIRRKNVNGKWKYCTRSVPGNWRRLAWMHLFNVCRRRSTKWSIEFIEKVRPKCAPDKAREWALRVDWWHRAQIDLCSKSALAHNFQNEFFSNISYSRYVADSSNCK